jgi:hypothetical protein
MQELTALLEPWAEEMDDWFQLGCYDARWIFERKPGWRKLLKGKQAFYESYGHVRSRWGFVDRGAPLLSLPGSNMKLDKASKITVGLTLDQYVTTLPAVPGGRKRITINSCMHAGDCAAVCVLMNGHGTDPRVIRARKAKKDFLVSSPKAFAYLLGYELQWFGLRNGNFLFRPNVASDVCWEKILPSMTGGYIPEMMSYGYSKWPYVLEGDGWLDTHYRVAYSRNEDSNLLAMAAFTAHGGSVAMVTSRRKGEAPPATFGGVEVVDADKTDEWIFRRGVIGDLSAKGSARSLIGKSNFVVSV